MSSLVAVRCIRDPDAQAPRFDANARTREEPVPPPPFVPAPTPLPTHGDALEGAFGSCPCGRPHPLSDCCLPLARRLRRGRGQRPSPFDEIRATSALLLWSLLAREAPGGAVIGALSVAARRFWGPVLATALDGGINAPLLGAPDFSTDDEADDYGDRLFDRTWGAVDPGTLTFLLGTLPSFVRTDPLLVEFALDWMLWDQPWLRAHPAGHWTARSQSLAGRPRVQRTYRAILRSRLGLWVLKETIPGTGFHLVDRLTGTKTFLHTSSDPWPDADERLLLGRVYAFGTWRLLGGRCLLLDPMAVDDLLTALCTRAKALDGPDPRDPRWHGWLKAELIPLVAGQWVASRLAPPHPDQYHGTYC